MSVTGTNTLQSDTQPGAKTLSHCDNYNVEMILCS